MASDGRSLLESLIWIPSRRGYSCYVVMTLMMVMQGQGAYNEGQQCCSHYAGNPDASSGTVSDESRLITELVTRYKHRGILSRPINNNSEPIVINFQPWLMQILEFDVTAQVLTTLVWKYTIWEDQFLRWDPDDYGGVYKVRLYPSLIWTPDIMLFNNMDKIKLETNGEMLVVSSNGTVMWVPPVIYRSTCPVDMSNFPFDTQECTLTFGSWTYNTHHMDLLMMDTNVQEFSLAKDNYVENSEWILMNTTAQKNTYYYPISRDYFTDITFSLTLQRRPDFYVRLLLLPLILLSVIAPAIFWIPPSRPDRTNMGYSLFSSFFLQFLLIINSSPPTSETKLATFCCVNIAMVAFATVESVLVINIEQGRYPFPNPCAFLAKILGCFNTKKKCHSAIPSQNCVPAPDHKCRNGNDYPDDHIHDTRDIYGSHTHVYNNKTTEHTTSISSHDSTPPTPFHTCSNLCNNVNVDVIRNSPTGVNRKPPDDNQSEESIRKRQLAATIVDRVCFVLYVAVVIVCFALIFPYP